MVAAAHPLGRFNVELTNRSCVSFADDPQHAELNRVYAFGKGLVKQGQARKQSDLAATCEAIVAIDPDNGVLTGAAAPRRDSYAVAP